MGMANDPMQNLQFSFSRSHDVAYAKGKKLPKCQVLQWIKINVNIKTLSEYCSNGES